MYDLARYFCVHVQVNEVPRHASGDVVVDASPAISDIGRDPIPAQSSRSHKMFGDRNASSAPRS